MRKILVGLSLIFLILILIQPNSASAQTLKIAVSTSQTSNINQMVKQLNYQFDQIEPADLTNDEKLKDYQILFINPDPQYDNFAGDSTSLAKFASNGGFICALGNSYNLLKSAFPEVITATPNQEEGDKEIKILDKGLSNYLGNNQDKIGFKAGWIKIKNLAAKVNNYVEIAGDPAIVSFDSGEGGVLFSAITPANQEEIAQNILKWLIFRSINYKTLIQNAKILRDDNLVPNDEIIASFEKQQTLKYTLEALTSSDIKMAAAITSGEILISVYSDNQKLDEVNLGVEDSPSIIELKPKSSWFPRTQAADKQQFRLEVTSQSVDTNLAVITLSNSVELTPLYVREKIQTEQTASKPNFWQSLKPYLVFIAIGLIGFTGIIILAVLLSKPKQNTF